ncbi:hypothetical protein GWA97_03885 [Flavobacterium sp. LaA7.5]|nr:hypothetical protein [Flavobacterium salilacus subsp. altitudinum]
MEKLEMIKSKINIFLLFLCCVIQAQTVEEINSFIGLSDSLHRTEIRIYKRYSITNGTELLRLYESKENSWYAEMYYFYNEIEGEVETHYEREELSNYDDFELIWLNIANSCILYLPPWDEIKYKFEGKREIYCGEDGYLYSMTHTAILDGVDYKVFVNSEGKYNFIDYSNPEAHLERFPEVDELISFIQILEAVRAGFNIWKEQY